MTPESINKYVVPEEKVIKVPYGQVNLELNDGLLLRHLTIMCIFFNISKCPKQIKYNFNRLVCTLLI